MEQPTATVSPLRRRMTEDMRMRKFEPKTQAAYLPAVSKLGKYLERSPDTATADDLRRFQLHLVDDGTSPITLNATISGLKFFFNITLNHPELMARMQPVKVPRTLPVVLMREEVSRLIAAAWNLKPRINPAATGTARSARARRPSAGSRPNRATFCRSGTTT